MKRNVLVLGAGVIGAYLAHVLIEAGNDVTILAREERAKSLNENGLVIYHHLQKKTTTNKVKAVTDVNGLAFDAAFVVMPYHKLKSALPLICTFNTKLLVLVVNNLSPAEITAFVKGYTPYPRWCWIFSLPVGMTVTMLMKFAGNHALFNALTAGWISIGNIWMFGGLLFMMEKAKER